MRQSVTTKSVSPRDEVLSSLGVSADQLPCHIAIIMDGNGRWAQKRGLPRIEGHRRGVHNVREIVEECCRLEIEQLTLYCLSVENWKRPKTELNLLMRLLEKYLVDERPTIMEQNVRLRVIGSRFGLPDFVLREMDKSIEMSSRNTGTILCLAINYSGRSEIVAAMKEIALQVARGALSADQISEASITSNLYTAGMKDPDLLIRTAGEQRVSNFLLWQISYAEIWVADVCWPEFHAPHLHRAIKDFAARERRYGGLANHTC